MIIVIKSISVDDRITRVVFESSYGEGVAKWNGSSPFVGKTYTVELDCEESLKLDVNTFISKTAVPSLVHDGFATTLIGQVESLFENRTASIRFGDALLLVEIECGFPSEEAWILVTTKRLSLYDANV